MKRILLLVSMLLVFVGCTQQGLKLTESSISEAPEEVQLFVQNSEAEGAYLYSYDEDALYVYLTAGVIEEGEDAAHFTNAAVESVGENLAFTYDKTYTDDLQNEQLKHAVLYKITQGQAHDAIIVTENGEETGFEMVSGK